MDGAVKLTRLRETLRSMGAVAVAYSGGVDSTLLLKVSHDELGDAAVAIIADGGVTPSGEIEDAIATARELGVEPTVIDVDLLSMPEFRENNPDRCYACKLTILNAVTKAARGRGISTVIDGSHAGDREEDRPGMKALRELGVRSPLSEAGFEKGDVRIISAALGLCTASKPASPCLATRVPFGQEVSVEKLRQIDAAERVVKEIGITVVRVRHHGDLAKIEVPTHDIPTVLDNIEHIERKLRDLGFFQVGVDPRGYRSGSLSHQRQQKE